MNLATDVGTQLTVMFFLTVLKNESGLRHLAIPMFGSPDTYEVLVDGIKY